MSTSEIVPIALADIGLSDRPDRQIRRLDDDWVAHLVHDTDPSEWDPIHVRLWPEGEEYPAGEEGRPYQVISGYHRTSAARLLDMSALPCIVRADVVSDAQYVAAALAGNTRHGKPMDRDELIRAVARLRSLGLSEGDIAKQTGVPRGTVHNWLSERDTNAGRLVRTQQTDEEDAANWGSASAGRIQQNGNAAATGPITLSAARRAQIGSALHDLLAVVPTTITPAELQAWATGLGSAERERLAHRADVVLAWGARLAEATAQLSKGGEAQ